jgi:hypothetical protein
VGEDFAALSCFRDIPLHFDGGVVRLLVIARPRVDFMLFISQTDGVSTRPSILQTWFRIILLSKVKKVDFAYGSLIKFLRRRSVSAKKTPILFTCARN